MKFILHTRNLSNKIGKPSADFFFFVTRKFSAQTYNNSRF